MILEAIRPNKLHEAAKYCIGCSGRSHNIQLSYANAIPARQRTICISTGKATNRGYSGRGFSAGGCISG